jgi:translation elongation factor EF-Tu-like GTPase
MISTLKRWLALAIALIACSEHDSRDVALETWRANAARATKAEFAFEVDEAFAIVRDGEHVVAIAGQVKAGKAEVGDRVLVPVNTGTAPVQVRLLAIEMYKKQLDVAYPGDMIGLLVQGVDKHSVRRGGTITMAQWNQSTDRNSAGSSSP